MSSVILVNHALLFHEIVKAWVTSGFDWGDFGLANKPSLAPGW